MNIPSGVSGKNAINHAEEELKTEHEKQQDKHIMGVRLARMQMKKIHRLAIQMNAQVSTFELQ